MAEREGFEPPIRFPVYTLSRRAPSTTRPSLRATDWPGGRRSPSSSFEVVQQNGAARAAPYLHIISNALSFGSTVAEEGLNYLCGSSAEHAWRHLDTMVKLRMIQHLHRRANRSGFRIICTVD